MAWVVSNKVRCASFLVTTHLAVGLALRLPQAQVHAFDIDDAAVAQGCHLAAQNGVADRVRVTGACSPDDLRKLAAASRVLVLSDCEGFESTLFDPENVAALARRDVLVEVHDFIDIDISTHLPRRFAPTHHVTVIGSVDDMFKVRNYDIRSSTLTRLRRDVSYWPNDGRR